MWGALLRGEQEIEFGQIPVGTLCQGLTLSQGEHLPCSASHLTPRQSLGVLGGPPWPGFLLALVACAGTTPGLRSLELCLQHRAKPPESRKSETNPFAFFIFIFGGSFALGNTVDSFSLSFALSVRRRRLSVSWALAALGYCPRPSPA